jgi:hypothetical protein
MKTMKPAAPKSTDRAQATPEATRRKPRVLEEKTLESVTGGVAKVCPCGICKTCLGYPA